MATRIAGIRLLAISVLGAFVTCGSEEPPLPPFCPFVQVTLVGIEWEDVESLSYEVKMKPELVCSRSEKGEQVQTMGQDKREKWCYKFTVVLGDVVTLWVKLRTGVGGLTTTRKEHHIRFDPHDQQWTNGAAKMLELVTPSDQEPAQKFPELAVYESKVVHFDGVKSFADNLYTRLAEVKKGKGVGVRITGKEVEDAAQAVEKEEKRDADESNGFEVLLFFDSLMEGVQPHDTMNIVFKPDAANAQPPRTTPKQMAPKAPEAAKASLFAAAETPGEGEFTFDYTAGSKSCSTKVEVKNNVGYFMSQKWTCAGVKSNSEGRVFLIAFTKRSVFQKAWQEVYRYQNFGENHKYWDGKASQWKETELQNLRQTVMVDSFDYKKAPQTPATNPKPGENNVPSNELNKDEKKAPEVSAEDVKKDDPALATSETKSDGTKATEGDSNKKEEKKISNWMLALILIGAISVVLLVSFWCLCCRADGDDDRTFSFDTSSEESGPNAPCMHGDAWEMETVQLQKPGDKAVNTAPRKKSSSD